MLSRGGYSMPYVAVLECQKRGAIHPHLAVRGFQDIRLLRRCWYKIVGKAQGQVNVKGPRPGTSPVKLARYLSKYISKDIDSQPREFEEHRYFCSLGIRVPTEQFQIVLTRNAREAKSKLFFLMFNDTLRRVGDYCTVKHWIGGGGDVRMDIRLRRPDLSLEQKHSKPSASSGAGVKFVDTHEGCAIVPGHFPPARLPVRRLH